MSKPPTILRYVIGIAAGLILAYIVDLWRQNTTLLNHNETLRREVEVLELEVASQASTIQTHTDIFKRSLQREVEIEMLEPEPMPPKPLKK